MNLGGPSCEEENLSICLFIFLGGFFWGVINVDKSDDGVDYGIYKKNKSDYNIGHRVCMRVW